MSKEIAKLSYEEARDELQGVVTQLEQQNVSLEASMALWERGEALAKHCENFLAGARKKLDDTAKDEK
jgi:exodeoxyribonuclease VII small subunit